MNRPILGLLAAVQAIDVRKHRLAGTKDTGLLDFFGVSEGFFNLEGTKDLELHGWFSG